MGKPIPPCTHTQRNGWSWNIRSLAMRCDNRAHACLLAGKGVQVKTAQLCPHSREQLELVHHSQLCTCTGSAGSLQPSAWRSPDDSRNQRRTSNSCHMQSDIALEQAPHPPPHCSHVGTWMNDAACSLSSLCHADLGRPTTLGRCSCLSYIYMHTTSNLSYPYTHLRQATCCAPPFPPPPPQTVRAKLRV